MIYEVEVSKQRAHHIYDRLSFHTQNQKRQYIIKKMVSNQEKMMIIKMKKCCKPRKIKVCKKNLKKLALIS